MTKLDILDCTLLQVPALPPSFKRREQAQEQLVAALLDSAGPHSTALTAPKSRVSSQGSKYQSRFIETEMSDTSQSLRRFVIFSFSNTVGGVGKTMITAAVVRDERIREAFTVIGWINLSQQPDIMSLQLRLYQQLSKNESMPTKQQSSPEQQLEALRKVAIGQTALVILDDIWDSNHESVPVLILVSYM